MGRCISLPKSTTVIKLKRSKRKHIILSQVHPAWKDMLISKVIKMGKEMDLDGEVQNCLREAASLKRCSARNLLVKRHLHGMERIMDWQHGHDYDLLTGLSVGCSRYQMERISRDVRPDI